MRKKLVKKVLIVLIAVATLSIFACKKSDNYDGYLNYVLSERIISIDTAMAAEASSASIIRSCIEGLLRESKNGTPEPGIAERYEISRDGLTYTFYLRDAYWNNGTPVTSNDFVFAWRRMVSINAPYSSIFSQVAHIKNAELISIGDKNGNRLSKEELGVYAIDDKTLKVELESPTSYFIHLVSFWAFAPLNEEFFTSLEKGMYGTSEDTYLSCGPFVLAEYSPGTYTITLDKNQNYWDAENVKIPGVKLQVIISPDIRLEAYKKDVIDIFYLSGSQFISVNQDKVLSAETQYAYPGSLTYISYQLEDENLGNINLRKAISYSINRESIVHNVMCNVGEPAYNATSKHYAFHKDTGEEFADIEPVYKQYCDDNKEKALYYYELAKKELGKDKFTIELMYANQSGVGRFPSIALIVKNQIEKNLKGVTIDLLPIPRPELKQKLYKHTFQLALHGRSPDYADPMSFLSAWKTGATFNYEKWSNEKFDSIYEECSSGETVLDYDKRWNMLKEAERLVLEDAVIIPLVYRVDEVLIKSNVTGFQNYMGKSNFMYVSKELE